MTVKKRTEPDWEDLRCFAALASAGSLSGAARALGLTHATIARRVASLEETLGLSLVEKRVRSWRLTRDGETVLARVSDMQVAAAALPRADPAGQGKDGGISGLVILSCTEGLALYGLQDLLADLSAKHPALGFEVKTDDRAVSLALREADIALRWARPEKGELFIRKLADVPFVLASRAEVVDASGRPRRLVGYDDGGETLPEMQWLKKYYADVPFALRTNGAGTVYAAVEAGLGAGLVPVYALKRLRGVRPVQHGTAPLTRPLWMAVHRDRHDKPSVVATMQALAGVFGRT